MLIVEDNAANRELMDYLLRAFGFETLKAVDGRIGLDVARRERPDLILCDIQMPEMDGVEFASHVKSDPLLEDVPLIAVTALAMVGDRERLLREKFDDYIAKPIEPQTFVQHVNAALPEPLRRVIASAGDAPPPQASMPAPVRDVLVVDDSPLNLQLKCDLLQPLGYQVRTALTPSVALSLARERTPDLIISDVGMSEGSGFDFIRAVKADAALKDIPFIFLSSTHWNESSRQLGLDLGAVRYLLRPIEPAVLLEEIRTCIGR